MKYKYHPKNNYMIMTLVLVVLSAHFYFPEFFTVKKTVELKELGDMISHIWIGMIIAISFMEAWIKFRAETSVRALTLDIGRTVFHALNFVETVVMGMIWVFYIHSEEGHPVTVFFTYSYLFLLIASITLILDVYWLQPILDFQGRMLVKDHFENPNGSPRKKTIHHVLYVILEVIKLVTLYLHANHHMKHVFV